MSNNRTESKAQAEANKAARKHGRQRFRVSVIAARIAQKNSIGGPRNRCYCCGRRLADDDRLLLDRESYIRGIDPECWQLVLKRVSQIEAGEVVL
jgi:hypothetical protein